MAKDVLYNAENLMRKRQFGRAIMLLEEKASIYEDNFEYNLLFGIACLYVGDTGFASTYFQKARKIKLTDTRLLLGQAALFLRRGETDRAVQYYIDILENEPENQIAKQALEFIRTKGDYTTICKWADTGDIEQFYPPLGKNPYKILEYVLPVIACVLGIVCVIHFVPVSRPEKGTRADLSPFVLSVNESNNAQEKDLASGAYNYLLSSKQITDCYDKAMKYLQQYRDNLSQIEVNRILNSNASVAIKRKARELMNFLEAPSFDTVRDCPGYKAVQKEPNLYMDCWVDWSGRVSNVEQNEAGYSCVFLVGYDTMENVEGFVPLHFSVVPQIETDKPVKVLAKITMKDGRLALEGRSVYQSVK